MRSRIVFASLVPTISRTKTVCCGNLALCVFFTAFIGSFAINGIDGIVLFVKGENKEGSFRSSSHPFGHRRVVRESILFFSKIWTNLHFFLLIEFFNCIFFFFFAYWRNCMTEYRSKYFSFRRRHPAPAALVIFWRFYSLYSSLGRLLFTLSLYLSPSHYSFLQFFAFLFVSSRSIPFFLVATISHRCTLRMERDS